MTNNMDIKKTVPDIDLNAELPVLENPVEM